MGYTQIIFQHHSAQHGYGLQVDVEHVRKGTHFVSRGPEKSHGIAVHFGQNLIPCEIRQRRVSRQIKDVVWSILCPIVAQASPQAAPIAIHLECDLALTFGATLSADKIVAAVWKGGHLQRPGLAPLKSGPDAKQQTARRYILAIQNLFRVS